MVHLGGPAVDDDNPGAAHPRHGDEVGRRVDAQRRAHRQQQVAPLGRLGGPLKAATISFGQALDEEVLDEAFRLAREAELMLVLGSSLVVQPAAALPVAAAQAGAHVVIVNRDETPLDGLAAVVIHGAVEEVVPALAGA